MDRAAKISPALVGNSARTVVSDILVVKYHAESLRFLITLVRFTSYSHVLPTVMFSSTESRSINFRQLELERLEKVERNEI